MINPRAIWNKVKRDQVLNLSELAHASGYDRGALSRLALPLIAGKISLADFKRILRKRQEKQERRDFQIIAGNGQTVRVKRRLSGSSGSVNNGQRQATADRFYAPSSKRADKSASRRPQSSPLHSTA